MINVEHKVGRFLCSAFCALALAGLRKSLTDVQNELFRRLFCSLPLRVFTGIEKEYPLSSLSRLNGRLVEISKAVAEANLLCLDCGDSILLEREDLLPGPFNFLGNDEFLYVNLDSVMSAGEALLGTMKQERFGDILTETAPWPP